MENKTTKDIIKGISIILALLGIILFFVFECHRDITEDNKAPVTAYKYKTSYKYKDEYFRLKDSLKNLKPIPPKVVEKYISPKPIIVDSVKIINGYLKLHPQKEKEILVNSDFIINYPKSPKLLEMKLSQDSLSMALYKTDNTIERENYPLYLGSYKYTWVDGILNIEDIPQKEVKKTKTKVKWNSLYLNGGYDVYNQVPTSGFEYNLILGRVKLDLNSEVLIMQQPELNLNAKIGYRLLK